MQYPNLELLNYQAKLVISQKAEDKVDVDNLAYHTNLEAKVFIQKWGTTSTGFDIMEDSTASWGGQAITLAYTTVMYSQAYKMYVVFYNNKLAYAVVDPTEQFLEDLQKGRLAPLSKALEVY